MADETRIYVNRETLEQKLSEFDAKLNHLNNLLSQYEQLKNEAKNVWGGEDENQAKAIAACDSAIQVVQQRIEASKEDKNSLMQLNDLAFSTQAEMGSQLDEAKSITDALLR